MAALSSFTYVLVNLKGTCSATFPALISSLIWLSKALLFRLILNLPLVLQILFNYSLLLLNLTLFLSLKCMMQQNTHRVY